jgi:hypothetical protein
LPKHWCHTITTGFFKQIASFFNKNFELQNIKESTGHHRPLLMELECESTNAIALDSPRPHHRKLPAEMNREIFLCFNPATQRKFIYGLGWDFYAMFRHRLLTKVFMK